MKFEKVKSGIRLVGKCNTFSAHNNCNLCENYSAGISKCFKIQRNAEVRSIVIKEIKGAKK